ncbi:LPS translocon maturation chaperone LptM [Diaphorobacter caeni]|uniref:LPS translocon maturation chaperone LptM n=1 Tax=Diaphorobacter caeni TaxID=2784387 RepID=UPI001E53BA0A|nr:lipoprotein [Diaphorobacter caeni]
MLKSSQILFRSIALAGIAVVLLGCGQRGPLFLPTEPAAANRATLPQTLDPTRKSTTTATGEASATPTPAAPPSGTASDAQR